MEIMFCKKIIKVTKNNDILGLIYKTVINNKNYILQIVIWEKNYERNKLGIYFEINNYFRVAI